MPVLQNVTSLVPMNWSEDVALSVCLCVWMMLALLGNCSQLLGLCRMS